MCLLCGILEHALQYVVAALTIELHSGMFCLWTLRFAWCMAGVAGQLSLVEWLLLLVLLVLLELFELHCYL